MNSSLEARLAVLEDRFPKPPCVVCGGAPGRIVGIDPETGEETSETMPEYCPACGALPFITVEIVGVAADVP